MKASTGPGKGVRTQGARAGPKGRLPSLASAFLPRRGDPQPRSDGVRRESDWVDRTDEAQATTSLRRRVAKAACSLACTLAISQAALPGAGLATARLSLEEKNTISLFSKATPSVVFITNLTNRRDVFTLDLKEIPQGAGSGFVWDDQGHIITNFHVIKGASDVQITFQDQKVKHGSVVGFDEDRDIAVLQVDEGEVDAAELGVVPDTASVGLNPEVGGPAQDTPAGTGRGATSAEGAAEAARPLPRGSSQDLVVGQRVYAIGNPFG